MNMIFSIAFGFLVTLLIGAGVMYTVMAPRWRNAQTLQHRFQDWTTQPEHKESVQLALYDHLSELPLLDQILKRITWVHTLERMRDQANSQFPLSVWLLLSAILASLTGFLCHAWETPGWGILLGVGFGLSLPFLYLNQVKANRIYRFQAQLPEALDTTARALRAGHSLLTGMQMVGEEFDDPIGPEFRRTIEEVTTGGIPFTSALANLSDRLDCVDLKYFVTALIIQREAGGNLTEVLESIASLIRQRFDLQDRIHALSAEGRFTAWFLFSLPLVLGVGLYFMRKSYMMLLFTHPKGPDLLAAAVFMLILGMFVTKRMIVIKV